MALQFANKVVLVTGASGVVGSGIARQFLLKGATVVAPFRSEQSATSFKAVIADVPEAKLDAIIADVGSEDMIATLEQQVRSKYGAVDHVVSSVGSWWQKGPLSQQTSAEVHDVLHSLAVSHFIVYKTFAPLLKDSPESSYLFITGAAGEYCFDKDISLTTVGAAALFGISLAARAEFASKAPRVNELRISARIVRDEDANPAGQEFSHRLVGAKVADIAASKAKGELIKLGAGDLA